MSYVEYRSTKAVNKTNPTQLCIKNCSSLKAFHTLPLYNAQFHKKKGLISKNFSNKRKDRPENKNTQLQLNAKVVITRKFTRSLQALFHSLTHCVSLSTFQSLRVDPPPQKKIELQENKSKEKGKKNE